jgi:hypothetical protein
MTFPSAVPHTQHARLAAVLVRASAMAPDHTVTQRGKTVLRLMAAQPQPSNPRLTAGGSTSIRIVLASRASSYKIHKSCQTHRPLCAVGSPYRYQKIRNVGNRSLKKHLVSSSQLPKVSSCSCGREAMLRRSVILSHPLTIRHLSWVRLATTPIFVMLRHRPKSRCCSCVHAEIPLISAIAPHQLRSRNCSCVHAKTALTSVIQLPHQPKSRCCSCVHATTPLLLEMRRQPRKSRCCSCVSKETQLISVIQQHQLKLRCRSCVSAEMQLTSFMPSQQLRQRCCSCGIDKTQLRSVIALEPRSVR